MLYKSFLHTHTTAVILFLLIYVIKTILLLSNKNELLAKFTKKTKVFEMIVSSIFLITGIYLATQLPYGNKYDYLFFIKVIMVLASIPIAIIGFKKGNKILAALSLLMITGSYGIAEAYSKRKGMPKDSGAVAATDGKGLYEQKCSMCHGNDGKLGLAGAKDLTTTELDLTAIKDAILNGRKSMQPVMNTSEEEAGKIAEYVLNGLGK